MRGKAWVCGPSDLYDHELPLAPDYQVNLPDSGAKIACDYLIASPNVKLGRDIFKKKA